MAKTKKAEENKAAPKKEKKVVAPTTRRIWTGERYEIVKI